MTNSKSLRILAVGDIMLGEHPGSLGVGVLSKWKQTGKHPFHHMDGFFKGYNVVIGNLECVLSNTTVRRGYLGRSLRAPPNLAKVLARNGFHVLSVANNHSMDHGYEAFKETVRCLQNAGILVCGTRQDPARMEVEGAPTSNKRIISFFGASFRPNDTDFEPLYPNIVDKHDFKSLKSEIHRESKRSDLVVIQCHWGDEFITRPSTEQIQFANELVQSGADIIIGHHPHVYQGLLTINGRPIFYSLGNFVSDMQERYLRRAAVGSILWDGSKLSSTSIPIRLDANHHPYLSTEEKDLAFIASVDNISAITDLEEYSIIYQQVLQKARYRYRIDTLSNLIRNLGNTPKQKPRMILDILRKLSGL